MLRGARWGWQCPAGGAGQVDSSQATAPSLVTSVRPVGAEPGPCWDAPGGAVALAPPRSRKPRSGTASPAAGRGSPENQRNYTHAHTRTHLQTRILSPTFY